MSRRLSPHSPLASLFAKHDDLLRSGFITRLDRSPVSRKQRVFLTSLAYNLTLLASAATLLAIVLSQTLSPNVPDSLRLTMTVTQGLFLFWAVYILLRTTSLPFFFGECRVRWRYGFRPSEIVIRRSPPESLLSDHSSECRWRASARAIDPTLLYSNPASILASDFWVMEHAVMLDVYAAMENGQIDEEDLEFTLWKDHNGAWAGLELWKTHNILSDQQEISLFKSFLTRRGKHELLSIWEEMFNTGFPQTPANYKSMVNQFSQEGIDYETIWSHHVYIYMYHTYHK